MPVVLDQRSQAPEPVARDLAGGHQLPETLLHLRRDAPGQRLQLRQKKSAPRRDSSSRTASAPAPNDGGGSPCRTSERIHGRSSRSAKEMGAARVGLERLSDRTPSGSAARRAKRPQAIAPWRQSWSSKPGS